MTNLNQQLAPVARLPCARDCSRSLRWWSPGWSASLHAGVTTIYLLHLTTLWLPKWFLESSRASPIVCRCAMVLHMTRCNLRNSFWLLGDPIAWRICYTTGSISIFWMVIMLIRKLFISWKKVVHTELNNQAESSYLFDWTGMKCWLSIEHCAEQKRSKSSWW